MPGFSQIFTEKKKKTQQENKPIRWQQLKTQANNILQALSANKKNCQVEILMKLNEMHHC